MNSFNSQRGNFAKGFEQFQDDITGSSLNQW